MEDNTQLLLEGARGLRSLAEALEIAAEILQKKDFKALLGQKDIQPELFEENNSTSVEEAKKEEKPLSLVEVRKILAEKSREGHTEQVRLLLQKYGADKLSAIDPSLYNKLADEASCLGATLEEIKAAISGLSDTNKSEGLPLIFEHHYATNLQDLKASYYSSFLRDIKRLADE